MYSKVVLVFLSIQLLRAAGQTTEAQPDVCQQPKVVGPCRASKPRFWYNAQSGQCEHFNFGGCHGNDNNFVKEEECVAACGDKTKDQPSEKAIQRSGDYMCHQPKVVGPCRASLPRFWYNNQTEQCEGFIYGGCEANENNFEKQSECVRICKERGWKALTSTGSTTTTAGPVQRSSDICSLPKEVGSCRALLPRFWFNPESKKCEEFSYGGCDGNANNFRRESECIATCVERDQEYEPTQISGDHDEDHGHQHETHLKKHDENGAFSYKSCLTLVSASVIMHVLFCRF